MADADAPMADANISSFMAITGSGDAAAAAFWLDAAGGNVELAVGNFLDGNSGGAPAPQSDADVAAALHAQETEHEVRAPDSVKRGRLMGDFPGGDEDSADGYTPGAMAFDDDEDDKDDERVQGGLSSIFAPPSSHTGDFQKARADGKAQKKWLLVVITNEAVFGCHEMNRDCWADETVQMVVQASFILWLRPHTDPQASTYCDRYDRDRALPLDGGYSAHPVHPHLTVVDPRTGRRVWTKDGKVSRDRLVELLSDVVERHSLEDLQPLQPISSTPPPPPNRALDFAGATTGGGAGSAFAAPPPPPPSPPAAPVNPWAAAALSPEPASGGVLVAFRGPGFQRRRRFVETDAVASLFKYVQTEFKPAGCFDLLCGFPPRQLAPLADTALKDADVHGQAVQVKLTSA